MPHSKFLTASQLIERWGQIVTLGTLANWRSKRIGPPYVKLGVRVLYPIDPLVEWEKQNQHGATSASNDNQ